MLKRYRQIEEQHKDEEDLNNGFTLIELLIVIVVLGVLAAIVIFSLTGVTGESKAAQCNADGKSIEIAADAYSADPQGGNGSFPANITALTSGTNTYLKPFTTPGYSLTLGGGTDIASFNGSTAYNASGGCDSLG